MRYIGVDVGAKKSGISISDSTNTFASPVGVVPTKKLVSYLVDKYEDLNASGIVLGESKNSNGEDNEIMFLVRKIEKSLTAKGCKVFYESEWFSSFESHRYKGDDSNAAAVILQRFLEKN